MALLEMFSIEIHLYHEQKPSLCSLPEVRG
jgi:hypothetical protein